MAKNVFYLVGVLVVGALIGSFLGQFLSLLFPEGPVHNLLVTDVPIGLDPTRLDLRIVDLTFGCMFKFNLTSIIGVFAAAYLIRKVWK